MWRGLLSLPVIGLGMLAYGLPALAAALVIWMPARRLAVPAKVPSQMS